MGCGGGVVAVRADVGRVWQGGHCVGLSGTGLVLGEVLVRKGNLMWVGVDRSVGCWRGGSGIFIVVWVYVWTRGVVFRLCIG